MVLDSLCIGIKQRFYFCPSKEKLTAQGKCLGLHRTGYIPECSVQKKKTAESVCWDELRFNTLLPVKMK